MSNYFSDRVAEFPGRVTMTPTGQSDTYDMARAEGAVTEPGSPFNAATFNSAIDLFAMWYGTCVSAAAAATKIVSCTGFKLVTGATISVEFGSLNSHTGETYMDVNDTGAKRIRRDANSDADVVWGAGEVVTFAYDGGDWIMTRPNNAKLVWSNPAGHTSQTSTMGEADITTDSMSGYNAVLVEFRKRYNQPAKVCDFSVTGSPGLVSECTILSINSNPLWGFSRTWWRSGDTTIHFSDCTRLRSDAAAVTGQDTGALVPLRIWAIRL